MTKTIYIAGKISGLNYTATFLKFWLREKLLWCSGFRPINPMRIVPKSWPYEKQMDLCLDLVALSDCIYLSDNWRNSDGARRELAHHFCVGKNSIYQFKILLGICTIDITHNI